MQSTDILVKRVNPPLAVELSVPDTFVSNVITPGSLRERMKFSSACKLMGIGFWLYSGESSVGIADFIELVAAMPYLSQPGQSHLRWFAAPIQRHANAVPIPDEPGPGVTVDPQALARCKERYERDGMISHLGMPGEMRFRQFLQQ